VHGADKASVHLVATDGTVALISDDPSGLLSYDVDGATPIVRLNKEFRATIKKALTTHKHNEDALHVVVDGRPGASATTLVLLDEVDMQSARDIIDQGAKSPNWLGATGDVLVDGTFPDYQRIYPKIAAAKDTGCDTYNSTYLSKFGALCPDNTKAIRIAPAKEGSPAWVTIAGRNDLLGIIMPMRSDINLTPTMKNIMSSNT